MTEAIEFLDILVETNQAYLFLFPEGKMWLPKSEIEDLQKYAKEDNKQPGHVEIPEWLAIEKGLV